MEPDKVDPPNDVLATLRRNLDQRVQEVKTETDAQAYSQVRRAEDILDTKALDGNVFYYVKWVGVPEPKWVAAEHLNATLLDASTPVTAPAKGYKVKGNKVEATKSTKVYNPEVMITNTTKTLELVVDALKALGGKGFGPQIVDWIMNNKPEAQRIFGNKKKLRYTINGLLSSRVNSSVFVKQPYTDKSGTKTEWKLIDMNYIVPKSVEPTSPSYVNETNNNPTSVIPLNINSSEQDGNDTMMMEQSSDEENETETEESAMKVYPEDDLYQLPKPETKTSTPRPANSAQPTYRDMIKQALTSFGGESTFDQITKYIESTFKNQLLLKAETWKHSIAGCLSVYFSRKDYKDNTGKVIWTLHGDPPSKKKRRKVTRKDDSDSGGKGTVCYLCDNFEAPKRTRSHLGEDMITVSADTYEALEEENEALKLMLARAKSARNARLRSETTSPTPTTPPTTISNTNSSTTTSNSTSLSHPMESCSCCKRNYLGLVVLPCKHVFCGVVFCEASMIPHCFTCGAYITGKVPREPEETNIVGEAVQ